MDTTGTQNNINRNLLMNGGGDTSTIQHQTNASDIIGNGSGRNGSSPSSSSLSATNNMFPAATTTNGHHCGGDARQNNGSPMISVVLTIRLLMQGKEVGSIIGKRGDHIKLIREESNAKINISDGSCPERIVTITGNIDTINKAFTMICRKFEDDMQQLPPVPAPPTTTNGVTTVPKPPITFRLIVPASQCGSIIGKGGSKIKDIREATGASIQVASEMLPGSTERAVTVSGTAESIILCMHQICQILFDSPPKGATIPYRPKPAINPVLLATSAAAVAAAAASHHHHQQQQQSCSNGTAVLPSPQNAFCHQFNAAAASPAAELLKIHPLNHLLPEFNPTVLAGSAFSATPNILSLSHQSPALFGPHHKLAMMTNAAATGDGFGRAYMGNLGFGRLVDPSSALSAVADISSHQQQRGQNDSASSIHPADISDGAASASNNRNLINPSSSTSSTAAAISHQQQRKLVVPTSSSSLAAAMASMAAATSTRNHPQSADYQTRQQQQQHHHQLALLRNAAALTGSSIRAPPISHQHQHASQIPSLLQQQQQMQQYYSPNSAAADSWSNNSTGDLAAAAAQQQQQAAAIAWLNAALINAGGSGCPQPLPPAIMMPPTSTIFASMNQHQQTSQLALALHHHHQQQQQAAAAAEAAATGGPIVAEKLVKRFTPY